MRHGNEKYSDWYSRLSMAWCEGRTPKRARKPERI